VIPGREADGFRGFRAAGIRASGSRPLAQPTGREADGFSGLPGRDPRERIPAACVD